MVTAVGVGGLQLPITTCLLPVGRASTAAILASSAPVAPAALNARPASTAYGTAPSFDRGNLVPSTCTSAHSSGFARTAPTHAASNATRKRPPVNVVPAALVVHTVVPAAAASHTRTVTVRMPSTGRPPSLNTPP